jgi:hypothetical protein
MLHLATDQKADEAVLGLGTQYVDLRRLDGAADIADRDGDPLQQRGAGDRYRRSLQEWRSRMLRREGRGTGAACAPALQLIQQVRGLGERALVVEDIRDRRAGHREQAGDHDGIEHHRDQRRACQRAGDGLRGAHGAAVFFGSTRASIWKRSPGSEDERVVGA